LFQIGVSSKPQGKTSMRPAENLQFQRMVDEFVQWRAVPGEERSPAPAWWWGPAFEAIGSPHPMPAGWCASLELPESASYDDGARIFLKCFAGQASLPWPSDFPRMVKPHAS
jgi:hypothetical protein